MKVLLRQVATGLYLGKGRKWTANADEALAFLDRVRAEDYRIYHRLADAAVAVLDDEGQSSLPLRAGIEPKPAGRGATAEPETRN